jgi:hypothetical protein
MDHLSNLVRLVRGSSSSATRDRDVERPRRPQCQRQASPMLEFDNKEPLDLEPL